MVKSACTILSRLGHGYGPVAGRERLVWHWGLLLGVRSQGGAGQQGGRGADGSGQESGQGGGQCSGGEGQGGVGRRLHLIWRDGGRDSWKEQGRGQGGDGRVAYHRVLPLPGLLPGRRGLEGGWGAGGSLEALRAGLGCGTGSIGAPGTCRPRVTTAGLLTAPGRSLRQRQGAVGAQGEREGWRRGIFLSLNQGIGPCVGDLLPPANHRGGSQDGGEGGITLNLTLLEQQDVWLYPGQSSSLFT